MNSYRILFRINNHTARGIKLTEDIEASNSKEAWKLANERCMIRNQSNKHNYIVAGVHRIKKAHE